MFLRAKSTGGFVRTEPETGHFHRLFHEHEGTNARILTREQCVEHFKCSAKRYKSDGLNTLDYEILKEENLNLIRNITVDLKFTNTKQPGVMCPYDYVFEKLGRRFEEKVLNGSDLAEKSDWLKNFTVIASKPVLTGSPKNIEVLDLFSPNSNESSDILSKFFY